MWARPTGIAKNLPLLFCHRLHHAYAITNLIFEETNTRNSLPQGGGGQLQWDGNGEDRRKLLPISWPMHGVAILLIPFLNCTAQTRICHCE